MTSNFFDASTDPEYLELLGRFAYAVSWLEWLVLGDLGSALPRPVDLDQPALLGKTTTRMGELVGQAARGWDEEPSYQQFGLLAEKALVDVGERRNHVLHARPATTADGRQRLLRDRFRPDGHRDNFWVDEDFLIEQIAVVEDWAAQLQAVRLVR